MAALSGTQSLCEGNYEVALRSTGCAWLRDEPLLDWRGLMDETPSVEVEQLPPPTAYFQLVPTAPTTLRPRPFHTGCAKGAGSASAAFDCA